MSESCCEHITATFAIFKEIIYEKNYLDNYYVFNWETGEQLL